MSLNFPFVRLLLASAVVAVAAGSAAQNAEVHDLMQRALPEANTLVLLKVDDVLRSRVGIEEGWGSNLRTAAANDAIVVPPNASTMLVTGLVEFELQDVVSAAAVFKSRDPASLAAVAKSKGREIETLSGLSGFRTTWDSYILQFDEQTFGVLAPANRQKAAQWGGLGARREATPRSEYLQKAASFGDNEATHVVMSVDLTHSVPPAVIVERLQADKEAGLLNFENLNAAAKWVSGVQGATLRLRFEDKISAQLRVDFSEPVPISADEAKPIIIRALQRNGMELPDLADWTPRASEHSLALEGFLSSDSLSLLMGLVAMPYEAVHVAPGNPSQIESASEQPSEESQMATSTKAHFDAVSENLRRLKLRRSDAKSFGQAATWMVSTASRIRGLSVLNVDEAMLDYSAQVADQLSDMSMAFKNVGIQTGARQAQYSSGYYYQDTWYGRYYNSYDSSADRRRVGAEERAIGAQSAEEIAAQIQSETADIRRTMSQKYQMDF